MLRRVARPVGKTMRGIGAAVRARPGVFGGTTIAVFALNLLLPVVVLSLARKPWDHFSFNPWLKRLPEWLLSDEATLERKLEFLPNMALFWFIADSPGDAAEWGFTVDVSDVLRLGLTSLLFGAFFALWFYRRSLAGQCGWAPTASRHGGVAAAFTSVVGFSTGPCSVVGCGAPVMPVVGLALVGLSSGSIRFLSSLSKVVAPVILVVMGLAVAYFGWLVGNVLDDASPPTIPRP